jgi:MarR family transcriptional regulator, lower aerobic nicotinate degradation pathway regulator
MPTLTHRRQVRESFSRLPGHLIRRAHQISTAYFSEECGGELTAVQYASLVAIGSHPGIDATRLSDVIHFDRSTIGDVLDRIESKGWIVRQSTANDRRLKLLTLSPAGKEILRQVAPAIRRVQERLLTPFTPGEAKMLIHLLGKIADAAKAERDDD